MISHFKGTQELGRVAADGKSWKVEAEEYDAITQLIQLDSSRHKSWGRGR